jgi:hypothetical protein
LPSFDHASHVIQSVLKMMSRFQSPEEVVGKSNEDIYSFSADPLTQFACAFSALIRKSFFPLGMMLIR